MTDSGPNPYVVNIEDATVKNDNYRTALWTGEYMQMTVMSILPGDDIGLEVHEDHDQFLRVEAGSGTAYMGPAEDDMKEWAVAHDDAILVPAGSWHNVVNTGDVPLKVYSIYSPPEHAHGTVHATKADAEAAEHSH